MNTKIFDLYLQYYRLLAKHKMTQGIATAAASLALADVVADATAEDVAPTPQTPAEEPING